MQLYLNKKNITLIILGLVTTTVIFFFLLKEVSFTDVKQLLSEIHYKYVLAFIILSLAGSAFRTWRYTLTLKPSGHSANLFHLYLITLVRNLFSDLLPARIGTTIYIYLANTKLGIPIKIATTSFTLSLLFDFVAIGPLVIIALLFAPSDFAFSKTILITFALAIFILTSLTVWALPLISYIFAKIIRRLKFLPHKFRNAIAKFSYQISKECQVTQKHGSYFNIFCLSVLVRICKYGSLYIFLVGMLIPLGYTIEQINPITCIVGLLSAELAASLPISGIAGFGAYEGAWAFTFSQLGFPNDVANLTAIAHHLFTQVWGYGIGLLALLILLVPTKIGTHLKQLNFSSAKDLAYQALATATVVILVFTALILPSKHTPQAVSQEQNSIPKDSQDKLSQLAKIMPGQIFFDSNRSGTFGIHSINTDGSGIQAVVDDAHWHEMYPDINPNGSKLVFSKARSLTRVAPSEIWLTDINGSNPEFIANGSFPTFSRDNNYIFYEYQRSKVMQYNITTKQTSELFPKNRKKFQNIELAKPRVSYDQSALVFTASIPSRWHAWHVPLRGGKAETIASGCEPSWFPDGQKIAWMKRSGAQAGSGIMDFNLASKNINVLKDDPGPFGHEYFPTITNDGNFVIYSSAPEDQHDHLTSNYQLHVYNIKTSETWRINFDKYNNRWGKYLEGTVGNADFSRQKAN